MLKINALKYFFHIYLYQIIVLIKVCQQRWLTFDVFSSVALFDEERKNAHPIFDFDRLKQKYVLWILMFAQILIFVQCRYKCLGPPKITIYKENINLFDRKLIHFCYNLRKFFLNALSNEKLVNVKKTVRKTI